MSWLRDVYTSVFSSYMVVGTVKFHGFPVHLHREVKSITYSFIVARHVSTLTPSPSRPSELVTRGPHKVVHQQPQVMVGTSGVTAAPAAAADAKQSFLSTTCLGGCTKKDRVVFGPPHHAPKNNWVERQRRENDQRESMSSRAKLKRSGRYRVMSTRVVVDIRTCCVEEKLLHMIMFSLLCSHDSQHHTSTEMFHTSRRL